MRLKPECLPIAVLLFGSPANSEEAEAPLISPYSPSLEVTYRQGLAAFHSANLDVAEAKLASVLETDGSHADALIALGDVQQAKGLSEDAVALYQRVLELKGDHAIALSRLGIVHAGAGNLEIARSHLARLEALCAFTCQASEALKQAIRSAEEAPVF